MTLNAFLLSKGIQLPPSLGQLDLTTDQAAQLELLVELFFAKNQQLNLSSIREKADIYLKHIYDSLSIFDHATLKKLLTNDPPKTLLDVGTGGGMPGLPLAIVLPKTQVGLLDATGKKIKAVHGFIQKLALENAGVVQARAEELGQQQEYRENFDWVIARAVAKLSHLAEFCLPLVRPGGYFLAYKEADSQKELAEAKAAIQKLGGNSPEILPFSTDLLGDRCFILIQKISHTAPELPRPYAQIKYHPL